MDTIITPITLALERLNTFEYSSPISFGAYSAIYNDPPKSAVDFVSITSKIDFFVYALYVALFILMILVYGIAQMYKYRLSVYIL